MKVSQVIADFCVNNSVDTVFGVTGRDIEILFFEISKYINVVNSIHEEASFFFAKGYYLASFNVPFIILSQGPGILSGLSGLAELVETNIPAVIISVIDSTKNYSLDIYQDSYKINVINIINEFKIDTYLLLNKSRVYSILNKAYVGSTFLNKISWIFIPVDILNADI